MIKSTAQGDTGCSCFAQHCHLLVHDMHRLITICIALHCVPLYLNVFRAYSKVYLINKSIVFVIL